MQKIVFTITFVLTIILFQSSTAYACTCLGPGPVLDAYDAADAVLTARVVSVDTLTERERLVPRTGPPTSRLAVEKIYKGSIPVNDVLVFQQGVGGNCVKSFGDRDVGERFLLYLSVPRDASQWRVSICGRSQNEKHATEDLLYLDRMDEVRGKTRVSGKYGPRMARVEMNVAGRKIRIFGASRIYEIKTDKNGIFEIYDLPPGKYRLEPELPVGFIIHTSWMGYAEESLKAKTTETSVSFRLLPQKHVTLDLGFIAKEPQPTRRM